MQSDPGTAACPAVKRSELMILGGAMVAGDMTEKTLLRRLLALHTHPYLHRRCLMATLGTAFKWCDQLEPRRLVKWTPEVRDEVASAMLFLPHAISHLRWGVDGRLSATDATPTRAGAGSTFINQELARQLFRFTEQRGTHVTLRESPDDVGSRILPVSPEICELTRSMRWHSTYSGRFTQERHINGQELSALKDEAARRAQASLMPRRFLSAQDNNSALGAWGKEGLPRQS